MGLPNVIMFDLFALNLINQALLYFVHTSSNFWSCVSCGLIRRMSSAYTIIDIFMFLKVAPMLRSVQFCISSSLKASNKYGD